MRWNTALYDAHHHFVADLASDLVDSLAPAAGERVLDLGCGTGRMLEALTASGARAMGVDADAEMVRAAQRRCPDAVVVRGDARDLSDMGQFDALLSNATLHWVQEADQAARSMAGALKPGGRAVLEFGGAGNLASVCRALPAALARVKAPRFTLPWYFPGAVAYRRLLLKAGFRQVHARLFPRPTRLTDGVHGLANWLHMFCSGLLSPLSAHQRQSVIAQVERDCDAEWWKGDHWELDYVRLRVSAPR
jgi:SAM-dependent methyltransferase